MENLKIKASGYQRPRNGSEIISQKVLKLLYDRSYLEVVLRNRIDLHLKS